MFVLPGCQRFRTAWRQGAEFFSEPCHRCEEALAELPEEGRREVMELTATALVRR